MSLFAHHAEAVFKVEILGRDYPDGMTEHAVMIGLAAVVLAAVSYGLYAAVRDCRRWLRKAPVARPEAA